jgi:hypothetical protein
VHVDAIEQRSTHFSQIALDDAGRATAFARVVSIESTRAPVQISTAP